MKKNILLVSILLFGFGCTQDLGSVPTGQENSIENVNESSTESTVNTETATNNQQGFEPVSVTKPTVVRTFTYDEIEQEDKGGVKEWMRQLARDNVAGKKTLVRMPVNHIQGFGCSVPVKYCVSAISGGCYGPYVDLKGNIAALDQAPGTVWGVEGYVVAASRVPTYPEGDPRNCVSNELMYDFQVTKVLNKLDPDAAEEFKFIEYSQETKKQAGVYEDYSADKLARASTEKVVLFFHAGWCPTCKAVDSDIVARLTDIPSGMNILKVNYDNSTELKKKYGVTYQHTFVQVAVDGSMIKKWSGGNTLNSVVGQIK